MSEEADLWKRTIVNLEYTQLLLKECIGYCNTVIRESQDTSIILGKVLDAKDRIQTK